MDEPRSALLGQYGPVSGGHGRGALRDLAVAQSRWHTCLVPPRAQSVIAASVAVAYDAGFWYGGELPGVPDYARALATAAYERGILDALTAHAA